MSPRTLIYVKNWCIYKINLVHLLFSTVFYIFKHNFVSFGPINMFLDAFWRIFMGLQKKSPNQSKPVHLDRSFCSLYMLKTKRLDCRSSLFQSWSGLFLVFFLFWSCDWTFKHYNESRCKPTEWSVETARDTDPSSPEGKGFIEHAWNEKLQGDL